LEPVRQQIKAWREIQKLPGPMPCEIWEPAIVLARAFGVTEVARAAGLNVTGLRQKVVKASEEPGLVKPIFLELPGRVVLVEAQGGTETLKIHAFHPDLSHCDPDQGPQLANQVPGAPLFFLPFRIFTLCFPFPNLEGDYNGCAIPESKKQQLASTNLRRIR
jgi:hypothetical protein